MPAEAGVHALIVGVSRYPHLPGGGGKLGPDDYGMTQLNGPALAAAKVDDWLVQAKDRLPVPLHSRRVLLSPSPEELAARPDLDQHPRATMDAFRENVIAWQKACASNPENLAFFYFSGHGVREANSVVVLLEEFARDAGNPLSFGASISNLFAGMTATQTFPSMARHQLWFVDSCQTVTRGAIGLGGQNEPNAILHLSLPGFENRCAPIFYAAIPGSAAFSIPGVGTVFGKTLIECLEGAAGFQRGNSGWKVTPSSLSSALQMLMTESQGGVQATWTGGQISSAERTIVRLDGVPSVRVQLELKPAQSAGGVSLSVADARRAAVPVPVPLVPNPFSCRWPAGVYEITAAPPYDTALPQEPLVVIPPVTPWEAHI